MKTSFCLAVTLLFSMQLLYAQPDSSSCKVSVTLLKGQYKGDCKNGLADGKGEAIGANRYEGQFKLGKPNGKGTYHYSDSTFYTGNMQDGIREGKGEMHYQFAGRPDSVIKGYWSADVYRGKNYKTYDFNVADRFDRVDIEPSSASGNSITFETSSTTGSPNGVTQNDVGTNYVLTLVDLISMHPSTFIRKESEFNSNTKASATYFISQFPCTLQGTLSNGIVFKLELYKAANWKAKFFINK
jgi:hypothetical protein